MSERTLSGYVITKELLHCFGISTQFYTLWQGILEKLFGMILFEHFNQA